MRWISSSLALGFLLLLPGTVALAQTQPQAKCSEWVAKIVSIEGRVESLPAGETSWRAAELEDTYCPEDRVRTLEKSRAALILKNETTLRLDENSMVKFSSLKPESPSLLQLLTGSAFFMSRYPRPLTIETPYVNAASGGTEFNIKVNPDDQSTTITVIEGQMNLKNEAGSAVVKAGEEAVTIAGQPPVVRIPVRPRDAIQWALYYPPILSLRDLRLEATEGLPETDWRSMVQRSITAYNEGDIAKAFSALEGAPAGIDDPRFYTYRASLLLSVGRVDLAKSDIEHALKLAPGNGLALALQSVIAVVQNDKEVALNLAMAAAEAEPDSVSVKIALSYAEQANFNLDEALAAVQQAVKLDPEASLAWARMAELWMSQGYLDKALEAANQAAGLNPREVRIQTVLGFAYLTEIKISAAKSAFEKAIALNSADPMPRLGLGLAMIREGNLEEGRKQIEIAGSLDPNNALIRSYLGKAYYEEKRDPQAEIQFQQAERLDPKDPTPYLYDAIRKQTVNRPVEALHDLEKSIELNDNRAVYRSQLLLDSDQAARSVNLGRIYDDLGFQQAALVEGFKSVNVDPANYSAHRFLSDSYATLPNSEIARSSELLQAQLLQPLNNNPVQPQLGQSAPSILGGAGPVEPSFNEYTQLFNRDMNQLLVSGIVGNQSTIGDEVILSGLQGRYSYSFGQFHFDTDGFRNNADLRQNIYDGFAQVSLTHNLSVQGEVRFNGTQNGDTTLRFDPTNFSPTLDMNVDVPTYRAGLHYALAPNSEFILSSFYQSYDERQNDSTQVGFPAGDIYKEKFNQRGYNVEGQYLLRVKQLNLNIGAGHFDGSNSINASETIPGFGIIPIMSDEDVLHTNGYIYSSINLPAHLTLSVNGSVNVIKDNLIDRTQWNPKLGLLWNPTPSTTLRVAGFRAMTTPLILNQTIEPTQVAGFQQFFDYPEGTDSKNCGVGIDQKFSSNLFGGVEGVKRNLKVPVLQFLPDGTTTTLEQKAKLRMARAYLNWTPTTWLAAGAEYYIENYIDPHSTLFDYTISKLYTHRIPFTLNLYHPTGLIATIKTTYVSQEGDFEIPSTQESEPGHDRFWIWDASVGYRLPKRFGIITFGIDNIFDRDIRYQETDPLNRVIQPERFYFTKVTLAF